MCSLARTAPFPHQHPCVKIVGSFEELIRTPFSGKVNALCWQRTLPGDYSEVVRSITSSEGIATLDETALRALTLSEAGRVAVEVLLEDQRRLRDLGLSPLLDCIREYPRDEQDSVVPTDVYSFHADSAPVEADTYLCSYTVASSEGVANDEAQLYIEIPEVRATLLERYGGSDDDAFREHLRDQCFDLHYVPLPDAKPYSFGLGNFWRIAVAYPESPVLPCVHRAPDTSPGDPPRLLLIS